jgi:membrane protein YdbS with pleckstrin-like domain
MNEPGSGSPPGTPESTKKNLAIWAVAATLGSLVMTSVLVVGGFLLGAYAALKVLGENAVMIAGVLFALAGMFFSFWLYSKIMKWATVRFSLEEKVPQLFRRKKG